MCICGIAARTEIVSDGILFLVYGTFCKIPKGFIVNHKPHGHIFHVKRLSRAQVGAMLYPPTEYTCPEVIK